MNDLLSLRSEVKQLSSLLQQLQSFLKTMSIPHQSQQHHPTGGGPSDGPSGSGGGAGAGGCTGAGAASGSGGSGVVGAFQGSQANVQASAGTTTPGQSARPQQSQQLGYDNKSYHLSPPLDSHSRFVTLLYL